MGPDTAMMHQEEHHATNEAASAKFAAEPGS
jgi:hypothetical protein